MNRHKTGKRHWGLLIMLLFTQLAVTACAENAVKQEVQEMQAGSTISEETASPALPTTEATEESVSPKAETEQSEPDIAFDSRDIDAINAMIANNGLSAKPDDPLGWDFAVWETDGTAKRIHELNLYDYGLSGQLDLQGLLELRILECSENQLTELIGVTELSKLQQLYCIGNQLQTLDVSGTDLEVLSCSGNQLQSLKTDSGELNINAGKNGSVMITNYSPDNNIVELAARPNTGYLFQCWTNLPADAPAHIKTSFPMTGNIHLAAVFVYNSVPASAKNLVGEYIDDNGDVNLIIWAEGEGYRIEIGIFRLTTFDDVVGTSDGAKILFTIRDGGIDPIRGEIIQTEMGADVIFTDSSWEHLKNGQTISYYYNISHE